mmetsp:Transcript_36716/g.32929  ORF Transcript_36716/g.32929 Transcript_36716/m.32929 type:complete len:225 (-) Transcript_36716:1288-1962(-)
MVCFTNGVKYKPSKTRLLFADVFWMLTQDDKNQTIQKAFDKLVDDIPTWIWILWIPQLLAATIKNRQEANASFKVLNKIGMDYPQAIYFYLKKFRTGNQQGNGYEWVVPSFNEIFETMKKFQPMLFEAMESFSQFILRININDEEGKKNEINNLINSLYTLESTNQLDKFKLKLFLILESIDSYIKGINFNEIQKMQSANLPEILSILKNLSNRIKQRTLQQKF